MLIKDQLDNETGELLGGFINRIENMTDSKGNSEYSQELDYEDFLKQKLYVQTKDKKLVKFVPNKTQRITLAVIKRLRKEGRPIRIICLKCRQGGFSTVVESFLFWDTISHPNTNSLVCAHEMESSKHLFGISKRYYENLPEDERPPAKYSTRQELVFEGINSQFKVDTANKRQELEGTKSAALGRSYTVQNLHASEIAFWSHAEVLMDSVMASIPDNERTSIFIESTGNVVGDYLYREWHRAREGKTDYVPIFVPWHWVSEYSRSLTYAYPPFTVVNGKPVLELNKYEQDLIAKEGLSLEQLNWRRWCIENKYRGVLEAFAKEFPATEEEAFSGTRSPYFDMKKIKILMDAASPAIVTGNLHCPEIDDPEVDITIARRININLLERKDGFIKFWYAPVKGKEYIIGGDVGEGIGEESGMTVGSYSAAPVFEKETKLQVATWHGHTDPDKFGTELFMLGHYYNTADIACEVNNHGLTTLTRLKRLGYPKIFCRYVMDDKTKRRTRKLGWLTTTNTREFALDFLATYIRDSEGMISDPQFLKECSTFVRNFKKHGRGEPAVHCFGDIVIAASIALAASYYIGILEKEIKKDEDEFEVEIPTEYGKFGLPKEFYSDYA